MAKYSVHVDVTLSGWKEIEANSEEEAVKAIKGMTFQPYDIKDFYYFSHGIVDIEEV